MKVLYVKRLVPLCTNDIACAAPPLPNCIDSNRRTVEIGRCIWANPDALDSTEDYEDARRCGDDCAGCYSEDS